MVTEFEMNQARLVVAKVLHECHNDREEAVKRIEELCKSDRILYALFAKVGSEVFEANQAVKH